ncbi:MAG: single-stranded DNA-binding protein [Flavobacteriales bacterium]|nr:single-stranded DNA-binding protein [Flavobacteriales bacterium]
MSINKVILIGHLGSDPEVRHLDGGRTVANFNIATNESYVDKQGNKIEQTEWHRLELWDSLAKVAEKYLTKGRQIYVEGKLKTDKWTDKEGIERNTTRIRVLTFQMLGGREENSGNVASNNVNLPPNNDNSTVIEDTSDMDDLPF